MSSYRFNVFGSLYDIEKRGEQWEAFAVGPEGKRSPSGFVVPSFVESEELEQFLFDLFHERASGKGGEIFRVR